MSYKSDIEIAHESKPKHIAEIAADLSIPEEYLVTY